MEAGNAFGYMKLGLKVVGKNALGVLSFCGEDGGPHLVPQCVFVDFL